MAIGPTSPGLCRQRPEADSISGLLPNAAIISVKVTDDNGVAYESDLLRGLDWVSQNRDAYHIGAVNLSVTTGMPSSYATSPIDAAVEVLVHQNVTVVAAAGNLGSADDAVWYAPANDPLAITVGCIDDNETVSPADDSLCPISSRGITEDGLAKPDMVAPGRKIVSTLASALNGVDVTLAQEFPDRITADRRHIRLSGTSMAAPMVAGAVALLLERQPGLNSEQVRHLLIDTTTTYPGQTDHAGSLNIPAALTGAQHPPAPSKFGPLPTGASTPPSGARTVVWDGSRWNTTTWDGSRWNTTTWDGSRWNTTTWDGSRWNTATWDGSRWNSTTWDGSRWNTTTWDGSRMEQCHLGPFAVGNSSTWDGARWNDASWDGSRWNGSAGTASRWNSSTFDDQQPLSSRSGWASLTPTGPTANRACSDRARRAAVPPPGSKASVVSKIARPGKIMAHAAHPVRTTPLLVSTRLFFRAWGWALSPRNPRPVCLDDRQSRSPVSPPR